MNKNQCLALVFPGQGSQYVGMGNQYTEHPYFKQTREVFDFNLSKLCFEGPADELKLTQNTQPAIVLHSMVLFDEFKSRFPKQNIDYILGHSVGEYSALCAAECMNLETALRAVHTRGKSMQDATPVGIGAMIAIMKLDASLIEQACKDVDGLVSIANHNSPAQVVISGESKACHQVVEKLKTDGHRLRAIELPVSAPFHCQLMEPAAQTMEDFFSKHPLETNQLSYISNIDAKVHSPQSSPNTITQNLVDQVCGQVKWVDSINQLPANTKIIEVGPGKVLAGLCSKIRNDIQVISLDKIKSWDEVSQFLEE